MLFSSFLLSLFAAFLIGSIWVTILTVTAERAGSKVGGVVGGLPSTVVFSFLFIGFNQSSTAVVQATTIYPLAFGCTCAFLLFFALFSERGFFIDILISLIGWFLVASLFVISGISNFAFSLIGGVAIAACIYIILAKKLRLKNLPGTRTHYGNRQLLGRAALAGSLVLIAVLLSQTLGPKIGGVFSAFPAVYTSTLYILTKNRGIAFSRSMTKPLLLSGLFSVIPYCIAVRYLFPILGIWLGTFVSYAIATPWAVLSYRITSA